jgi:hypothetical protein
VVAVDNPKDKKGNVVYELQIIKVYALDSPFFLVNLYSKGGDQLSLRKITSYITQDNNLQECVITGDFNAYHH